MHPRAIGMISVDMGTGKIFPNGKEMLVLAIFNLAEITISGIMFVKYIYQQLPKR